MGTATPGLRARQIAKRTFDVAGSIFGLIVLSPAIVGVGLAVAIWLGRPILFRQIRPGLNGKVFALIKFRTMTDQTDDNDEPLPDEHRLTRFGRFLRATSLDELPELWNVLKGDMSLVGPRPLLVEYLPLYSPSQARRHEMRPGITGWAQVKGRNALTWEQKFDLDVWYVDNWSLALDLRILAMTVRQVLSGHGITAEDAVTAHRFRGSGPTKDA